MDRHDSISKAVEALLRSEKTLEGRGQWTMQENGKARYVRALSVAGEITDARLEIHFYTREKPPKFNISLLAPSRIWALDFDEAHKRTNSLNKPSDIPAIVTGPHYHSWEDNRRFATKVSLPSRLLNARPLPHNIRSYENALRWFCDKTNIILRNEDIVMPPKPDTLL